MSYRFADSLRVGSAPLLCVQRKTPDDGQRNCPEHVEFYSKNKFEKLVHLVGFITRIYHDARSPERQNNVLCTVQTIVNEYFHAQNYTVLFLNEDTL